ncbi:MAG: TetR/AcrR family transcriptional regulator [Pseudomonadota bacterium]
MPRKPVRADGLRTYQKLLDAVDNRLNTEAGTDIRLTAIAAETGLPVASVYHFFPNPEAALAAVTEKYVEQAAIEIMSNHKPDEVQHWQDLVKAIFARGRIFYQKHPAAQKLRLGPVQCESVRHLVLVSNWALAEAIQLELQRLFAIQASPGLIDDLAYAIAISDALWSLSVSLHGVITDDLAFEAERMVVAFLSAKLEANPPPST